MGRELHKTEPLDLRITKTILQSKGGGGEDDSINLYFKNCAVYQASVVKNKWMELGEGYGSLGQGRSEQAVSHRLRIGLRRRQRIGQTWEPKGGLSGLVYLPGEVGGTKGKTKTQTCDQVSVGKMKRRTDLSFHERELHVL